MTEVGITKSSVSIIFVEAFTSLKEMITENGFFFQNSLFMVPLLLDRLFYTMSLGPKLSGVGIISLYMQLFFGLHFERGCLLKISWLNVVVFILIFVCFMAGSLKIKSTFSSNFPTLKWRERHA